MHSYLRKMLLLYLVQQFQSVSFSLAQGDALRFHWPVGHPWNRTSVLCTNRAFSFCGDIVGKIGKNRQNRCVRGETEVGFACDGPKSEVPLRR
jgi:hypothetical protein